MYLIFTDATLHFFFWPQERLSVLFSSIIIRCDHWTHVLTHNAWGYNLLDGWMNNMDFFLSWVLLLKISLKFKMSRKTGSIWNLIFEKYRIILRVCSLPLQKAPASMKQTGQEKGKKESTEMMIHIVQNGQLHTA